MPQRWRQRSPPGSRSAGIPMDTPSSATKRIDPLNGPAFAPVQCVMTGEQLMRLHQNPFYVQAFDFLLDSSTKLSEMLEEVDWRPSTAEQRNAIQRQCERLNESRLVLQQFRELAEPRSASVGVAEENRVRASI